MKELILLPGLDVQQTLTINTTELKDKDILVIGEQTILTAREFLKQEPKSLIIIVDNYEALIQMRIKAPDLNIRMMEFENTDFRNESFDVVYAQASISSKNRNKIIKEIYKLLRDDGTFSLGEIITKGENVPVFINDIYERSDLLPLKEDELSTYYTSKKFIIINEYELSYTLEEFYQKARDLSTRSMKNAEKEELSYYKKLINKVNHESNAYLKQGGKRYMGFKMLLLKKEA
ncbi:MAG: methyltransferase domain-containing protein [Syntrophothermus sp.]|nr:class I SAM-dependent methyltransferase [Ignavibacteriaceae bacterium]